MTARKSVVGTDDTVLNGGDVALAESLAESGRARGGAHTYRTHPGLARALLLTAGLTLAAEHLTGHAIQNEATLTGRLPSNGLIVTVTEGPSEPRSIGSYALRVYDPVDPEFPYDRFIAGTVRKRDGGVEDLLFSDLDDDGVDEVVVTVRSAGSGGYLSADAFAATANGVTLTATVAHLTGDTDVVQALRDRLTADRAPAR